MYLFIVAIMLGTMLFVFGGCGGGGGEDKPIEKPAGFVIMEGGVPPEDLAILDELDIKYELLPADKFTGDSLLSYAQEQMFPLVFSYPAGESNLVGLTETITKAFGETRKRGRFFLRKPSYAEIEMLRTSMGIEGFGFSSGDAEVQAPNLKFYGLGRTADGDVMEFICVDSTGMEEKSYSSSAGETKTIVLSEDKVTSLDYSTMFNWADKKDESFSFAAVNDVRKESAAKNIFEDAKSWTSTFSATWKEKSFQINTFIVAVHHFMNEDDPNGGNDFYYFKQENLHNGAPWYLFDYVNGRYTSRLNGNSWGVNGAEVADNYMGDFLVKNYAGGNKYPETSSPHPQAINAETTHTSSSTHSFSASVNAGYNPKGVDAGGSLEYGYSASESKTFSTYDVEATLGTNAATGLVEWTYKYKRAERGNPWRTLTHPAALATSTYAPVQYWLWKANTADRNSFNSVIMEFKPMLRGTYSRNSGSISPEQTEVSAHWRTHIELKGVQPPLLALENKLITCNKQEQTIETGIGSQGAWNFYFVGDKPSWISEIKRLGGKLYTVIQANDTGVIRNAEVRIYRETEGKDKWQKIDIVQKPTEK